MAQRYIYIQDELNNRLKEEDNASALISELLREHYQLKDARELSPEELDKRIAILKAKIEAQNKIKAIENGTAN
jgi:uncharacterized small protein (DUF1192 family)